MKNRISSIPFLKQLFPVLVLLAVLACAQGCASYQLRIPDSDPAVETYEGGAMNAYVWGIWYNPQVMAAECQGEGINDVVVKQNYLQALATVVTLGIWMPTRVTFRCKAPHGDVGAFPEAPRRAPTRP